MNFVAPSNTGITVYTKSQCRFCDQLKLLLLDSWFEPICWVPADDYILTSREEFLNFIDSLTPGQNHHTFPIVFYNGIFIGGFRETSKWVQECSSF